jgi:hypothetical protein
MSTHKTEELLKKINYIEADLEIQRQILVSIPSAEKEQIETCIKGIARRQAEIKELRTEIQRIDPDQYQQIIRFEKAVEEFKALAQTRQFNKISGRSTGEQCQLSLKNGQQIECLVAACDENGDWAVIDELGQLREISQAEVLNREG